MYATIGDITARSKRELDESEKELCKALLQDSAIIIDAYGDRASDLAKRTVSCNMVLRALGSGDDYQMPIGASQGTVSALGYSQTWSMNSGSVGELYLSRLDKKLLGAGNKIAFKSPLESQVDG